MPEEVTTTETEKEVRVPEVKVPEVEAEKTANEEVKTEGAEGEETKPNDNKPPKWLQERLNEMAAQKNASDRKAGILEDQVRALMAELATRPKAEGETGKPQMTEDQIRAEINKAADEKVRVNTFNDKCNQIFEKGTKDFPDFKDSLATFNMLGGLNSSDGQKFLQAAIELDEPHKVLHYLGNNPDEAQRVMRLGPTKMAVDLAKLEASINREVKKPVSKTPAPVRTVDGRASAERDLSDEKLPMDEFMKRREKDIAERFKARGR